MSDNHKIELLAPAGSPACALAAFDAGADAVYAGLAKFNARERGENFTPESMGAIIDYAHKNGRRVYVTFNTLLKENELPEAMEMLAQLRSLGPDALLIQDAGVARLAREYFPGLEIHASTQMGIHNSAGLLVAARMGFRRVVLERQVTLAELEKIAPIAADAGVELEIFAHGALCCSLSGSCFFSSWLGGASGNRGKCKQPCRRRYFSRNGNGFFFSPQDLFTLDLLPELRRLGVASLKIEGRLRQSDYVAAAVRAYRMTLDAEEPKTVIGEARRMLAAVGGRHWSHGFNFAADFPTLIRHDAPGAAGQRCGTVEATRDNGFGFTAARRLFIGDRLRIQPVSGEEGPALTLTKFFVDNQPARRVLPGERVFVCCDKPVPERGMIFRIGGAVADYSARVAALPPHRRAIDMKITLERSAISIATLNTPLPVWRHELDLAPARQCPITPEQLREIFSAADSDIFSAGKMAIEIAGAFFLPVRELRNLRREFWKFVHEQLPQKGVVDDSAIALARFRNDWLAMKPTYQLPERLPETVALKARGAEPANRRAIRANSVFELNRESDEAILPEFMPEEHLKSITAAIAAAYAAGIRRFRVTSLYGLELLRKYSGIEINICTPLPVANSFAAAEFASLGATRVMAHIELDRASIEALREKSPVPIELYRLGRPALLTTRAVLPISGEVHDARKNHFSVRYDHRDHLSRIFPMQVMSVPRMERVYDFYDLRNATWNTRESSDFNFSGEWA